jgi:hypothetical protein
MSDWYRMAQHTHQATGLADHGATVLQQRRDFKKVISARIETKGTKVWPREMNHDEKKKS